MKKLLSFFLVALLFVIGVSAEKVSAYTNTSTWTVGITQVTNIKDYGGNVYSIGNSIQRAYTGKTYNINTTNVGVQVKITGQLGSTYVWVDGRFVPDNGHLLGYSQNGNTYLKTFLIQNLSHGTHTIEIKASQSTGASVKSDYIYVTV